MRTVAGTGSRSVMTAFFCRSQWDATEPCDQWFPAESRSTLASKHVRGPCGVSILALYLAAIFDTVEWCLPARVLSIEVSMTQCSRFSR